MSSFCYDDGDSVGGNVKLYCYQNPFAFIALTDMHYMPAKSQKTRKRYKLLFSFR